MNRHISNITGQMIGKKMVFGMTIDGETVYRATTSPDAGVMTAESLPGGESSQGVEFETISYVIDGNRTIMEAVSASGTKRILDIATDAFVGMKMSLAY